VDFCNDILKKSAERVFYFFFKSTTIFLPQNGTYHYRFLPSLLSIPETRAILSQISHSGVNYGKA